ncbi:MAG: hypothetical protein H6Q57_1825 [Geobacteraceae bacterium]|nr:hypothetical protein [Geobacteraceae bacterium]
MFGNEAIDYLEEALVTLDFVVSLINMQPEENVAMTSDKKPFRQTATYQNIVARIEIMKTKLNDSSLN